MGNKHPELIEKYELEDMEDQTYRDAVDKKLNLFCEHMTSSGLELKILVIGREGHGKSSFINTLFKTLDNGMSAPVCKVQDHNEGGGYHTGTTKFHCYSSKDWATTEANKQKFSWLKVYDTRGWKFSDQYSTVKEAQVLEACIDGWLKQDAEMDESKNVKDKPGLFEKKKVVIGANRLVQSNSDRMKVDIIVWIFDSTTPSALTLDSNGRLYKIMADLIRKSGCPWVVAFTKTDEKTSNIQKCSSNLDKLLKDTVPQHLKMPIHNVQEGRMHEPVEDGIYASHLNSLFRCLIIANKIRK